MRPGAKNARGRSPPNSRWNLALIAERSRSRAGIAIVTKPRGDAIPVPADRPMPSLTPSRAIRATFASAVLAVLALGAAAQEQPPAEKPIAPAKPQPQFVMLQYPRDADTAVA